ncbi:MAG: hypothetical protein MUE63_12275, partial [Xanthomonadales bacterium]|nr:hypothetical protein [Xanthomonadales bacterium]
QDIVRENTESEFGEVSLRVRGLLESRLAGLREQLTELIELRGKNKGVVEYMMGKVRALVADQQPVRPPRPRCAAPVDP